MRRLPSLSTFATDLLDNRRLSSRHSLYRHRSSLPFRHDAPARAVRAQSEHSSRLRRRHSKRSRFRSRILGSDATRDESRGRKVRLSLSPSFFNFPMTDTPPSQTLRQPHPRRARPSRSRDHRSCGTSKSLSLRPSTTTASDQSATNARTERDNGGLYHSAKPVPLRAGDSKYQTQVRPFSPFTNLLLTHSPLRLQHLRRPLRLRSSRHRHPSRLLPHRPPNRHSSRTRNSRHSRLQHPPRRLSKSRVHSPGVGYGGRSEAAQGGIARYQSGAD